jgi:hypothetical protein
MEGEVRKKGDGGMTPGSPNQFASKGSGAKTSSSRAPSSVPHMGRLNCTGCRGEPLATVLANSPTVTKSIFP